MKRFLWSFIFFILISITSISSPQLQALDCEFQDVPEASENADVIAAGNIISKDNDKYKIEVERSWKRNVERTIYVYIDQLWGTDYLIGEKAIIFLSLDDQGRFLQPLCTLTVYENRDNINSEMSFNESIDYLDQLYNGGLFPTSDINNSQSIISPLLLVSGMFILLGISSVVIILLYRKSRKQI